RQRARGAPSDKGILDPRGRVSRHQQMLFLSPLPSQRPHLLPKHSDHHGSSEEPWSFVIFFPLQYLYRIQNLMSNGDMLLQPSSMQPSSFTAGTSMRVMVSDGLCDTVQS
ncbi:hypothetical protein XENOCAPTIV_005696, partial [Xenoophorus captivus]